MLSALRAAVSGLPAEAPLEGSDAITVKRHQSAVRELLAHGSPHRGLLLYHGLGSGKSCASLVAAGALLRDPGRRLVVMTPASLRRGFETEMGKCAAGLDPSRVTFVSTNGISPAKVSPERAAVDGVSLHGAVVIVDEVHNLVSQVVNKGVDGPGRGPRLFRALYQARDAKLVLLSGTPVVNRPFEVAVLMCLLRGPVHTIVVKGPAGAASEVTRKLMRHPRVEAVENDGNTVTVLPVQSERHAKAPGGATGAVALRSDAAWAPGAAKAPGAAGGPFRDLGQELRGMLSPRSVAHKSHDLFPLRESEFEADFVDADANRLRAASRDEFMTRVAGRVSHYAMSDPEKVALGFPAVRDDPDSVVRLPMTKTQFERYVEQMEVEASIAKRLDKAKKRGTVEDGAGVHRTLTRMVCNFAFAKRGQRPFPSTLDASALRDLAEDGGGAPGRSGGRSRGPATGARRPDDKAALYRRAVAAAMDLLRKGGSAALREPALSGVHSPKMGAILSRVSAAGAALPALVYSQFRALEGVGIMAAVLDANGYAELRLAADGSVEASVPRDRPLYALFDSERQDVLAAFNGSPGPAARPWFDRRARERAEAGSARPHEAWSPIDVLFITQAGAEGINLRGVRQVHVQEPYWNEVRIQQVIGRAARTKSHEHLPEPERNVTVFRYLATLTPEQRKNKDVQRADKGRTSDEVLHELASRKSGLVATFLDAIAAASVDCGAYPGARRRCWSPPSGGLDELRVVAQADARAAGADGDGGKATSVRAVLDPGGKTLRLFDKTTGRDLGKVFDARAFREEGRLVEVAPTAA